jgi:hypothetical protein
MKVRIESPLAPEECKSLLIAAFDEDWSPTSGLTIRTRRRIIGRFASDCLKTTIVGASEKHLAHTSWPVLHACVAERDGESVLVGHVGDRTYTRVLFRLVAALLAFVFLPLSLIAVLLKLAQDPSTILAPLGVVVTGVFFLVLVGHLSLLRDEDADELINRLASAMSATSVVKTAEPDPLDDFANGLAVRTPWFGRLLGRR